MPKTDVAVHLRRHLTCSGSSRARNRAALLGSLLQIVGVVPAQRGPRTARQLPSLEAGERLCEAFELLRVWDPETDIDFEQAVLLATGIAAETAIKLDTCAQCKAAVLLDKLGLDTPACALCKVNPEATLGKQSPS